MSIGIKIRSIREDRNMTQSELAEIIGVSQSMLCQIERGSKAPSLPLSVDIAAALGCKVTDFCEEIA